MLKVLIIFNILLKEKENGNIKKIFTSYFLKIDKFNDLNDFNILLDLSDLEEKINLEIERIKSENDYCQDDYDRVVKIIKDDPLINENKLLMYFHGHTIYDIFDKILKKMLEIKDRQEREIIKKDFFEKQKSQKLQEYNKNVLCIRTALISNFNYCYLVGSCPSFAQIIQDVKKVVKTY